MTDRELLEMAAKAAGIDGLTQTGSGYWYINKPTSVPWNPLTDDGDRYRLERDLRMSVNREIGTVRCGVVGESFVVGDSRSEAYAIVRAAAEIGKEMP